MPYDAIVIGAGQNGLVAANKLVDEGWRVLVLEAAPQHGGAVRSSEAIEPGFVNDHASAFYPLGAASPVIKELELEKWGLVWKRSPLVLAHPATDGTCPVISTDLDVTVASLNSLADGDGDGDRWAELFALWQRHGDDILDALFRPFPPVRTGLHLARSMPPKDLIRFARFGVLPVRGLGGEYFKSPASVRLMAGLALHGDFLPESALSGFFGWFLASLAQQVGFPVPEGGASGLTDAMANRLKAGGGDIQYNARVASIIVKNGKATGVRLEDGTRLDAPKGVLADVDAASLYTQLVPEEALPSDLKRDLERFQWDHGTVKIDWNLDGPVPWLANDARKAGTVHIAESIDELSITSSELARGMVPELPFMLFGQHSMTDPTRTPPGKDAVWAYTHVPTRVKGDSGKDGITGKWDARETEAFALRMEGIIETLAPGFKDLVRNRQVLTPGDLEASDSNLRHGAINAGTSALHQQLVFRPVPGLARSETPIANLYLAGASAHPGGGVHGACGANAARSAIAHAKHKVVFGLGRRVSKRVASKASVFP